LNGKDKGKMSLPTFKEKLDSVAKDRYYNFQLLGQNLKLYQHSYLQYGLMEARLAAKRRIAKNLITQASSLHGSLSDLPSFAHFHCFHPSHKEEFNLGGDSKVVRLVGTGAGWNSCLTSVIHPLFAKNEEEAPCEAEPCSFNGIHMPPIPDSVDIVAFSYFFDRLIPAGLPSPLTVAQIAEVGQKMCEAPTEAQLRENPDWCLDLAYIHALLTTGYGIALNRPISVINRISDYEAGWSLGYAIKLMEEDKHKISTFDHNNINNNNLKNSGGSH
jgi:guanosine-diphosphatase